MTANLYGPTIYPRDKHTPDCLMARLNCIMMGVRDKAFIMCLVEPFRRSLPRPPALTGQEGRADIYLVLGALQGGEPVGGLGFLNQPLIQE